jgi:hypothetical protein
MRRKGYPIYGNRFIGDRINMEVHDLDNEKTKENECQINKIMRSGNVVIFSPDTLQQALSEGFKKCKKCISSSS